MELMEMMSYNGGRYHGLMGFPRAIGDGPLFLFIGTA
jgi:hypothetical protein